MQIDAKFAPRAMGALVRLARSPGWARVVQGSFLDDPMDRADAELLVAVGVLAYHDNGAFRIADSAVAELAHDPDLLARVWVRELEEAARYAQGTSIGWEDDREAMLIRGRSSAQVADALQANWLAKMESSRRALENGGRFLDVGTGIAAISIRMCSIWPDVVCTGIDVSEFVLEIARDEVTRAGLQDRVLLRHQDVCYLDDVAEFDLAWLPQPYLSAAQFQAALARVYAALRPDRWVVAPLGAAPDDAPPFDRAAVEHFVRLLGGDPIELPDAVDQVSRAGFVDVTTWGSDQIILAARKPSSVSPD